MWNKSTLMAGLLGSAAFIAQPAQAQAGGAAPPTPNGIIDPTQPATAPTGVEAGVPAVAAGQGGAAAASPDTAGLAEIIVTAQRRAESAQRAGIAISVLQPDAIKQVTSPTGLTTLAPALQIDSAGGSSPILYVRGVGTFSANPYTDSAIAVNYDGVYLGRPTSTFGLFYDLDRIEVLKGPQGTLYGRNATGGALNVIPAQPKIGLNSVDGTLAVGNYSTVNAQIAANVALSDSVAFRIAGTSYSHDGYNSDGTFDENGAGARAQLLFKPSDRLSVRIAGDYFNQGGTGAVGILLAGSNPFTGAPQPANLGPNVGPYDPRTVAILNGTVVQPANTPYGPLPARPFINNSYYGVSSEINYDLGFGKLTVIPSWRRSDLDNISAPALFLIRSDERDEQYSAEARLAGTIGRFDWLVGGFYFHESVDAQYIINQNVIGVTQQLDAKNKSYAGFGRLTWHVLDGVRLTGAVRYTKDKKTFDGDDSIATEICTVPTGCPLARRLPARIDNLSAALASIGYIQPPGSPVYIDATGQSGAIWLPTVFAVNGKTSPSRVTYRLAAEYEPRAGSLLYASFETGYRSGGFSFSTLRPVYQPENIDAWTIGTKNRFWDNRVQINVEAFYWKYKDQQLSHQSFGRAGNLEFVTENVGSSINKGVEAEIALKPLRDTLLHADIQYLSARNKRFVFQDVDTSGLAGLPPGTVPPSENCPFTSDPASGTYRIDCSGLRALRSPKWTLNLGGQQNFDLPKDYRLTFTVDTHYQTSNIIMFERRAYSVQNSYWQTDASITLTGPNKSWSLGAFVNNIENRRVNGNAYYSALGGIYAGIYGPPRSFGGRLGFHF